MTERFALDWLRLREPADLRARDRALARRFGAAVRARAGDGPASLVDLGAGSGANFRALAPLIPGDQEWRLVDHDPALLGHQAAEIAQWARGQGYRVGHGNGVVTVATGTAHWRAHSVALDLAAALARAQLAAAHGVACAALLDLVSAPWLDALVGQLEAAGRPFLAALVVDGRRLWQPGHGDDGPVESGFARHQRTDKGFGPALGPAAARHAAARLERRHRVATAASEWRLGPADEGLLAAMIDATAAAAAEAEPAAAARIAAWRADRQRARAQGELRLAVGHVDIFAEPDES